MKRTLEIEDLFRFNLAGDVQLSPDSQSILWVNRIAQAEDNSYKSEIFHRNLASGNTKRFTHHPTDSSPRYSPDGNQLAFLSRRSGSSQVWLLTVNGGEARQLTDVTHGVQEFTWSPDGTKIAFIAKAGPEGILAKPQQDDDDLLKKHTAGVVTVTELLYKMDGVGYFGPERPVLSVISTTDPEAQPTQLTQPPYLVSNPVWTPDGDSILVKGRLNPDNYDRGGSEQQVWAISAAGGEPRQVTGTGLSVREVAVSPDGRQVAVTATRTDGMSYDNAALFLVPYDRDATSPGHVRKMTEGYDHPLDNSGVGDFIGIASGQLTWSADGKTLFTLGSERGATYLVRIDATSGAVERLTECDQHIYSWAVSKDGRTAVFAANEPLRPGVMKIVTAETPQESVVHDPNEELLNDLDLRAPQRFTAQAEDGPPVEGWLIRPHGNSEEQKQPAVLNIHGGPALMYTSGFFFEFQLLSAQGYAVVYGNPRGSHGYGEEFCQAIKYEWGGPDYRDLMALADQALADNDWIDPERFGVAGGSYGGYMTNWIVGHTDRFAAAVTGRSIADWRSAIGSGDLGTFRFKRVDDVPFWEDNTWYEQQSPITYVGNVRTPTLVEHQAEDHRCTIDQAFVWYSALKYLNKAPTRLVIYPEEGHGMSRTGKPWNRIHRLKEILAWFGKYLRVSA